MNELHSALSEAIAATADTDPRELDAAGRAIFNLCEDRIEQIIEKLVRHHDEAGPEARALLGRFRYHPR